MDRHLITEHLRNRLEPMAYVNAFWYEGADANGSVDQYSDIDYYVDIDDDYEDMAIELVENALRELGEIDYKYVMNHGHPKLRQRVYHIEGTSEYLMIDFVWQLHSRDKEEYTLIKGDKIEAAKVIFDKASIIRYKDLNIDDYKRYNDDRLSESKYRYTQHARVIKYVYRGQYSEAYAYYNRYVVEPLVNLLRLTYTPAHAHYYLIHISSHLPREVVKKLESFIRVSDLKDFESNIQRAQTWFGELIRDLE